MLKVIIPTHLNIDRPSEMPIIKLIKRLNEKGYRLIATTKGDLVAVPIETSSTGEPA